MVPISQIGELLLMLIVFTRIKKKSPPLIILIRLDVSSEYEAHITLCILQHRRPGPAECINQGAEIRWSSMLLRLLPAILSSVKDYHVLDFLILDLRHHNSRSLDFSYIGKKEY